MYWELLMTVTATHVIILWGFCAVVRFTRPRVPNRVSFFEMQARAVRVRDVVLPAIAAAILGFFVSLAASFVHGGFSAPVATVLHLQGSTYIYAVFVGVMVSLLGFLLLMDRIRSDARSLVRHPASINRAAVLLQRGKDVEGLEAYDLRKSLDQWQARAGREAMRIYLWRKDSPHANALLQELRRASSRPQRPRGLSVRLLRASVADQRLRGVLMILGFVVPFCASAVAACVAIVDPEGNAAGWRIAAPLVCAVLQLVGGAVFLRLNATYVIRCWRIDEIELRAAKRRITRLLAEHPTARFHR